MPAPAREDSGQDRSRLVAFIVCVVMGLIWGVIHLFGFPEEVVPLTYAIPLMFCVWTRSRTTVWAMAAAFAVLAAIKVFWILPVGANPAHSPLATFAAQGINIVVAAAVVHLIISLGDRLERKRKALEQFTVELQASNRLISERNEAMKVANDKLSSLNHELIAREEEISQQNAELQTQSEELTQQNEELQSQGEELEQQTEELTAQAEELHALNDELNRRERLLETLLSTTSADNSKPTLLESICRQGITLLGQDVVGVSVLQEIEGLAHLTAYVSRPGYEAARRTWRFEKSLARIVVTENRTACLQDVRLRPDLVFPEPVNGAEIRSVLASPLRVEGRTIGALEFYCLEPRPWTQDQFRLAEWAAVQTSQVLESWQLREELEESERRFRAIFEHAGIGLAHVGLDGRFMRLNPRFCEITGYAPVELSTKTFADITHPEDIQADLAQARRLEAGEIESYTIEKRYVRPDGTAVWVNLTGSAVRGSEGGVLYYVAAIEDITLRKQAEQELRFAEQRLGYHIENSPLAVIEWDSEFRVSRWTNAAERVFGWKAEEVQGLHPSQWPFVHEDDRESVGRIMSGLLDHSQPRNTCKNRNYRRDGSIIDCEWHNSALLDGQGRVISILSLALDVTARDVAEAKLSESRRHLQLILDTAPISINYVDVEERFRFANKPYATRLGFTPDELIGRSIAEIVGAEAYAWIGPRIREALAGKSLRYEMQSRYAGAVRDLAIAYEPDIAEDGQVRGVVVVLEDITERKLAQETLAQSEQHLRLALEAGSMGTWEWAPGSDQVEWSDNVFRLLGYEPGRMKPSVSAVLDRVHIEDRERQMREWRESMEQHREYSCEFRVVRPDGSTHWLEARGQYVYNENGQPLKMYGVLIPVTLRKQIEQERQALLEAERAARTEAERVNRLKDEFLATVSHELRSPLNAIVGWTRLLARGKVETTRAVDIIDRSASSLTQLVEDLLEMSRIISGKIRLERESADLMRIVTDVLEGLQPAADAKSIHIDASFDPHIHSLECDPNRIQQVIWNLLTNAIKFTPAEGRVCVRVRQAKSAVEVVVQDTGQGISREFLPHIFDRFRQADGSIARKHGGLGLGLSIVKHLVELHGGTISAESAGMHQGATFTVSLPCGGQGGTEVSARGASSQEPLDGREQRGTAGTRPGSVAGMQIVVADDDAQSCELLFRVLSEAGCVVRTADCAEKALQLLAESRPDVLISDIGMPGQDGYSFVRAVRSSGAHWADVTCVALTALARPEDRSRVLEAGFDDHLSKPFDPGTLISLISDLVARNRARSRPVWDLFPPPESSNHADQDPTASAG